MIRVELTWNLVVDRARLPLEMQKRIVALATLLTFLTPSTLGRGVSGLETVETQALTLSCRVAMERSQGLEPQTLVHPVSPVAYPTSFLGWSAQK